MGNTQSVTTQLLDDNDLYLKLTVTDATNTEKTAYLYVYNQDGNGEGKVNRNNLQSSETEVVSDKYTFVKENNQENNISYQLFPNPCSESVNIQFPTNTEKVTIIIASTNGKLVEKYTETNISDNYFST